MTRARSLNRSTRTRAPARTAASTWGGVLNQEPNASCDRDGRRERSGERTDSAIITEARIRPPGWNGLAPHRENVRAAGAVHAGDAFVEGARIAVEAHADADAAEAGLPQRRDDLG